MNAYKSVASSDIELPEFHLTLLKHWITLPYSTTAVFKRLEALRSQSNNNSRYRLKNLVRKQIQYFLLTSLSQIFLHWKTKYCKTKKKRRKKLTKKTNFCLLVYFYWFAHYLFTVLFDQSDLIRFFKEFSNEKLEFSSSIGSFEDIAKMLLAKLNVQCDKRFLDQYFKTIRTCDWVFL